MEVGSNVYENKVEIGISLKVIIESSEASKRFEKKKKTIKKLFSYEINLP